MSIELTVSWAGSPEITSLIYTQIARNIGIPSIEQSLIDRPANSAGRASLSRTHAAVIHKIMAA